MIMTSSQRLHSSQSTEISAPMDVVWKHLCDFETWNQWNPSVLLPSDCAPGHWGKAMVVRQSRKKGPTKGKTKTASSATSTKKKWISTSCFVQDAGQNDKHKISFTTQRGMFRNVTCMKLTCAGSRKTLLTHTQTIYGPFFTFRSSPSSLLTNSSCINQCLKNHVECVRFRSLLLDASTVEMASCEGEEDTVSSGDFWTSSVEVRNAIVSQLMEEENEM